MQRRHVRNSTSPLYATCLVVHLSGTQTLKRSRSKWQSERRYWWNLSSYLYWTVFVLKIIPVSDVCSYFQYQGWKYLSFINVSGFVSRVRYLMYTNQNKDLFAEPQHARKLSTLRNFSNDWYTPSTFCTALQHFWSLAIHPGILWLGWIEIWWVQTKMW